MRTIKMLRFAIVFYILIPGILLSGCMDGATSTTPLPSSVIPSAAPHPQIFQAAATASGITLYTYKDLVERAEWIVIGQPVEALETYNVMRQSDDISKPLTDLFKVAQVFRFEVERYLKGSGKSEIFIVNLGGLIPHSPPSQEEIDQSWSATGIYHFKIGVRYILFLNACCSEVSGYDIPKRDYVSPKLRPAIFEISSNGEILNKSPWGSSATQYPPLTLDEMIERIQNPDAYSKIEVSSFPAPPDTFTIQITPTSDATKAYP